MKRLRGALTPGMSAPTSSIVRARPAPDWLILALASVAQFMVVLDVSIVNVALPAMKTSLGFSNSGLQWVLNAYTLAFAGFLLLGGRAADLYGRRRMFIAGLVVFTGASLLGGFAANQAMLVTARAVQGLGGAILSPTTLTILTTTFTEPRARSRAMGLWSAVAGAGGAAGALLGGVLTQELSWRWILFINLPIGLAALAVAGIFLRETRGQGERQPLDLTGAVLVTAGLTSFVYGLVRTTAVGWTSWQTVFALVLAAALVGAFLVHESKFAKAPLMPLSMFARRSIWSSNLVMTLLAGAIFAMWFFVSLYLQEVLGYSPLRTGFAFLPQTVAIILGAQVSSRLILRIGARPILVAGGAFTTIGLYWLSFVGIHSAYWSDIFAPSVFITLGLGLSFTPIAFAATSGVAPQEAGLASGLVNTSRQMGGAVGLAVLATLATSETASALRRAGARAASHSAVITALSRGYTRAFAIGSAIAAAAMLSSALVPKLRRPAEAGAAARARSATKGPLTAGEGRSPVTAATTRDGLAELALEAVPAEGLS